MKPLVKYSKKYQILVNDVDFTKKMKLSAAFNYFQEIAGLHSSNIGIGFNTIEKEKGVAWVLIRMRVDMIRYPVWDEEVILETWPQLPKKYRFERDFYIKDLEGNIIAKAVSTWVIVDVQTKELRKAATITIDYPEIITKRAIDCALGKITPYGQRKIAYERVIGCSDIDMNGHLNNSKYVDFIMDCFTMDSLKEYYAKSIQVQYISEALVDDKITLYKYVDELSSGRVYIEGINEENGTKIFASQIDVAIN